MRASNRIVSIEDLVNICKMNGTAFEASAEITLPANGASETIFLTGVKPVILYSRELSYDGDGINAYIYRNPDYVLGTQFGEINNPNDINPKTSLVQINTDATLNNIGIKSRSTRYVFGNTSNQGNGGALELIQSPQIILPNSAVLLVQENRNDSTPQLIASHLAWIEPDNIPAIELDANGNFVGYRGVAL